LGLVENRRSLLYVDNLVDVISLVIDSPKASGETFHVSDGEDQSVAELVRSIARAMERSISLLPVPPALLRFSGRLGDLVESLTGMRMPLNTPNVMRLLASLTMDTSKLRSKLGWRPPFTMEEGLIKTVQWYKEMKHQAPMLLERRKDF